MTISILAIIVSSIAILLSVVNLVLLYKNYKEFNNTQKISGKKYIAKLKEVLSYYHKNKKENHLSAVNACIKQLDQFDSLDESVFIGDVYNKK